MQPANHPPPAPRVHEAMTAKVHTLHLDDSLHMAARLFEREHFHHVVVLERGRVFGVVSDRDILKAISPFVGNSKMERAQDIGTLKKRVHQIMTRRPVTIGPEETVAAAAEKMLGQRVSCLPVVSGDGALLGIITIRDLVRQLAALSQAQCAAAQPAPR